MNTTSIADTFIPTRFPKRTKSVRLRIEFENEPDKMTSEEFWEFCQENHKIRAELTKEGDVIIMPPTGWNRSKRNAKVIKRLEIGRKKMATANLRNQTADLFCPTAQRRSPDAAWVLKSHLNELPKDALDKFLPLYPDFVVEMTSPSDSLSETQEKMLEYIENGAQLGWLIHAKTKQIFIYRPNITVEVLENPSKISG